MGTFGLAVALHARIDPSPVSVAWVVETCNVVDVKSAQYHGVVSHFSDVRKLPDLSQRPWWRRALELLLSHLKVYAPAELARRDTVSVFLVVYTLVAVEAAAKDATQHAALTECLNDLEYCALPWRVQYLNMSPAPYATGAMVALVGRNEGGKVLRREAVHAVLELSLIHI